MKHALESPVFMVIIAFVVLTLAFSVSQASGRQDPPPTTPVPEQSAGRKNDKDIPPAAVTAIAVAIVTAATCAWKRFALNDPCYTSAPRDTSAEDDWITPPSVRDSKQALQ